MKLRHIDLPQPVCPFGDWENLSQKKGFLFVPADALDHDPVVLQYIRSYLKGIEVLREGKSYHIGPIHFSTPLRHNHPVETYGLTFSFPQGSLSLIADTLLFPELIHHYQSHCLIINVVRLKSISDKVIYHLCLDDVKRIITEIKPRKAFLTHFGMTMLQAKPWELAEELSQSTGIQVIACSDGMTLSLESLFI